MSKLEQAATRVADAINLGAFGFKAAPIVSRRLGQLMTEIARRDKQRKHLLLCATREIENEG